MGVHNLSLRMLELKRQAPGLPWRPVRQSGAPRRAGAAAEGLLHRGQSDVVVRLRRGFVEAEAA